jgi:hypothetical protein
MGLFKPHTQKRLVAWDFSLGCRKLNRVIEFRIKATRGQTKQEGHQTTSLTAKDRTRLVTWDFSASGTFQSEKNYGVGNSIE